MIPSMISKIIRENWGNNNDDDDDDDDDANCGDDDVCGDANDNKHATVTQIDR